MNRMRRQYFLFLIFISLAVLIISCSELKKDLPSAASNDIIVHSAGWIDTNSIEFHGNAIKNAGWDMRSCSRCHGADYAGGSSGQSCRTCHNANGGPENCATCHGMPPPPALDGSTASTAHGVGAHVIHLNGTGAYSSYSMTCQSCHHLPTSIYDPLHINATGRALVTFTDPLASLRSGGLTPSPVYNPDSLKCMNTFCHGTWRLTKAGLSGDSVYTDTVMVGSNYAPRWNGGTVEKKCGTCHALPPTGHKSYSQNCSSCHVDVTTASGKLKHMNGKIDLAGGIARNFR